MRALVTGGSGFVGTHLLEHLGRVGDDAVGVDRSDGSLDVCDPASIAACLREHRPEIVYHLAGDSDVGGSWNHPASTFEANALGTLNLLEGARAAGVGRVLLVASADIYGRVAPDELPLRETSPLRPVSPYAASKTAADVLGLQAFLGHDQDVIRVRPFNHIGPGQSPRFVAAALARRIAENEISGDDEVPVGNLDAARDFTDVRDVVRAYRLLAERGVAGEAYNVCSGKAVPIAELVERLLAAAERPMRLVSDPTLFRPVDIDVLVGDCSKLTEATGWRPEMPLERTIGDLLADARSCVRTASAT